MNLREVHLTDLSKLRSRAFICEFGGKSNPQALVLEFTGKYGVGSDGNNDAAYMEALKSAWLAVCHANALVFDLRQLDYEWGNSIWNVFHWGWPEDAAGGPCRTYPVALVVSDRCRKGFSTCKGMIPPMFDDLNAALLFVEAPARKYLDDLLARFES